MPYKSILFILILMGSQASTVDPDRWVVHKGYIAFTSDAPLELIQARSTGLKGVIDKAKNRFAFTIDMQGFEGFNSPLQREHFNENYLETRLYPKANFSGKIIEAVDWDAEGTYQVRAKGKLKIHGEMQERIIKSELTISKKAVKIRSTFKVPLEDHKIGIPKIMFQKIAEHINVTIEAEINK